MNHAELGSIVDLTLLKQQLKNHEPITYSENGNRAMVGEVFLEKIQPVMAKVGISRLAEISQLDQDYFPVFQAVRPNILCHATIGQNSGGQGKGLLPTQAKISAIMETIEGYCAEPKQMRLIRGSYNYLKKHHVLLPPDRFFQSLGSKRCRLDEPVMWTPALHAQLGRDILIPAGTVHFPFLASDYQTRGVFPCTTNGLASGATYLEATNHGIYELIERYYIALWETTDLVQVDALSPVGNEFAKSVLENATQKIRFQLYSLRIKDAENLPFIMCLLIKDGQFYFGYGCAPTVPIAVTRAMSEAIQVSVTLRSGAREDLEKDTKAAPETSPIKKPRRLPKEITLTLAGYALLTEGQQFETLGDEFDFLVDWLEKRGYTNLCLANLTRRGIDIPVVRVVIPGLPMPVGLRQEYSAWDSQRILASQYGWSETQ